MNFVCGAFWVVSPSHSDPQDWSISTHLALKQWLSGVQCDPTPLHESVGSVCRALCCHKWRKEDALGSLCLESGMQPNTVNVQCEEFPQGGVTVLRWETALDTYSKAGKVLGTARCDYEESGTSLTGNTPILSLWLYVIYREQFPNKQPGTILKF